MLLVLELREGDRQKVQEFKVILDCLVNLRPVQEMRDPFLKIKKRRKKLQPLTRVTKSDISSGFLRNLGILYFLSFSVRAL